MNFALVTSRCKDGSRNRLSSRILVDQALANANWLFKYLHASKWNSDFFHLLTTFSGPRACTLLSLLTSFGLRLTKRFVNCIGVFTKFHRIPHND